LSWTQLLCRLEEVTDLILLLLLFVDLVDELEDGYSYIDDRLFAEFEFKLLAIPLISLNDELLVGLVSRGDDVMQQPGLHL
jgi:hypothetical protein